MLSTMAGSKASGVPRRACQALAIMAVPILLSGCVSGQSQSVASFAQAAAEEVAAKDAAEADVAGAATTTALAPIRRENGTISGSQAIDRMIAEAADANNIPRDLAFGVVHVESTYNPRARGRGVYGLSQIMPSTARSLGFSGSAEDLLEPAINLRYGMRYLAGAWEKGGRDVCRASMKYKGGHRASTMTRSAAAYCGRVRQHMARIAGNPILSGAPVQLAVNAPATAATPAAAETAVPSQVAAAVPTPARASETSVATALTANAPASNAATAAIEAGRSSEAGRASPAERAVAQPSARPDTSAAPSAVAEAVAAAPTVEPTMSLSAEPASAPTSETFGEPDSARFGG